MANFEKFLISLEYRCAILDFVQSSTFIDLFAKI